MVVEIRAAALSRALVPVLPKGLDDDDPRPGACDARLPRSDEGPARPWTVRYLPAEPSWAAGRALVRIPSR